MLRLLADENLNYDVVRGVVVRRRPGLDIVRVQAVGLSGAGDPEVLAWAANEQRVVLTHDVNTMTRIGISASRAVSPWRAYSLLFNSKVGRFRRSSMICSYGTNARTPQNGLAGYCICRFGRPGHHQAAPPWRLLRMIDNMGVELLNGPKAPRSKS